jgi:hypothetical protein
MYNIDMCKVGTGKVEQRRIDLPTPLYARHRYFTLDRLQSYAQLVSKRSIRRKSISESKVRGILLSVDIISFSSLIRPFLAFCRHCSDVGTRPYRVIA